MFDKTGKNLILDKETQKCFKEIENREKVVSKIKCREYVSYKPTASVNNLLAQNTHHLKKV